MRKFMLNFWSHTDQSTGCWIWTGYTTKHGYGQIKINGKKFRTHRVAWELKNGPIPEGLVVCHKCDNRACVNPDHLFLGTYNDNNQDCVQKGRNVFGERNHFAVLTEAQVEEIRSLKNTGLSQQEIAKRYGVSQANVSAIWLGKVWRKNPQLPSAKNDVLGVNDDQTLRTEAVALQGQRR